MKEGSTLVTETFDCSGSPEWLRQAVRGGDRWIASITATLEKLDQLAAHSAAGHPWIQQRPVNSLPRSAHMLAD